MNDGVCQNSLDEHSCRVSTIRALLYRWIDAYICFCCWRDLVPLADQCFFGVHYPKDQEWLIARDMRLLSFISELGLSVRYHPATSTFSSVNHYVEELFERSVISKTRGHALKLRKQKVVLLWKSYRWNLLDADAVSAATVNSFNNHLQRIRGSKRSFFTRVQFATSFKAWRILFLLLVWPHQVRYQVRLSSSLWTLTLTFATNTVKKVRKAKFRIIAHFYARLKFRIYCP